jgi:ActR/RegA family two-component response regulator
MSGNATATDVVLVVEDEESVRRTVRDWLLTADLDVRVLTAADSAAALILANDNPVDLAVLDWNLGAGLNGLDLLQDLHEFHPDLVAIMMTAYADRATPLEAMRCGVRDYLDKNHELTRETFLAAVRKQLGYLRPAKRERQLHRSLVDFRNSVEKILPLVGSLAALNDPVTLPEVIGALFRFVINATAARDGVLFVRHYDPARERRESCRVYRASGEPLETELVPFPQSVAATAISMQEPCLMTGLDRDGSAGALQLQSFEKGHSSLLAAPLAVAPGVHVVMELFDKRLPSGAPDPEGFGPRDVQLVRGVAEFGAEMLRHSLAQRQTHEVLLDAVGAALEASQSLARGLRPTTTARDVQPPPDAVMAQLREGLTRSETRTMDVEDSVRLAEAIRVLAVRHGSPAVRHCIQLVENLRTLLDGAAGLSG